MSGHTLYRFGEYTLDPAKRMLWDGDDPVAVQPKVFACLAYLIENRDRTVSHDELIKGAWGPVNLSNHVVVNTIGRARQAVGDTGEEQRVIRTLARVGYSWVLPVKECPAEPTDQVNGQFQANGRDHAPDEPTGGRPGATASLPEIAGPRRALLHGVAWGVLILLVSTTAIWAVMHRDAGPAHPADSETAVVLPVTVIGDESESWVRLGIMEYIADRLRAAGQAVVPSDNTVALVRDLNGQAQPDSVQRRAIAQATTAGLIMNARAERIGDHWRITLSTVNGRKPRLTASGDAADIFAAAHAAADRMGSLLGHAPQKDDGEAVSDLDRVILRAKTAILADRLEEARALLTDVGEHEQDDPQVRLALAWVTLRSGEAERAEHQFRTLLQSLSSEAAPLIHAHALYGIGVTLFRQKDPAAEKWLTQAIQSLEQFDSFEARTILGRAYMARSSVRSIFYLNLQAAQADLARARVAFQDTADRLALAKLDANLAFFFTRQMRYADAIPVAQRAVADIAAFGDVQNELRGRLVVAISHLVLANLPAASEELQHIDRLLAKIEDPKLVSGVNYYRVAIWHHSGRTEAARELLAEELSRARAEGWKSEVAKWEAMAAEHALRQEDNDEAVSFARLAVTGQWIELWEPERARSWLVLLRAQLLSDNFAGATVSYASALEWAETVDREDVQLPMLLLQAEYAAALDDFETAREYFQRALVVAETNNVPIELVEAVDLYARRLIEKGELDQASIVIDLTTSWAATSFDAALLQVRLHHALGSITAWRAAVDQARILAGEREIPPRLLTPPDRVGAAAESVAHVSH